MSSYNLGRYSSHQIATERQKRLPPPDFVMQHLLQGLYGVDAPAHWEAYSEAPSPITGFKGASRQEGMEGDYGRKLQKRKAMLKLKGNEKGERGKTGKENGAFSFWDRRLCQWGSGASPGRKKEFHVFRRHKEL